LSEIAEAYSSSAQLIKEMTIRIWWNGSSKWFL